LVSKHHSAVKGAKAPGKIQDEPRTAHSARKEGLVKGKKEKGEEEEEEKERKGLWACHKDTRACLKELLMAKAGTI